MYPLERFIKSLTEFKSISGFAKAINMPQTTLANYVNRNVSVLDYSLYLVQMLADHAEKSLDETSNLLSVFEAEYNTPQFAEEIADSSPVNVYAESGRLAANQLGNSFSAGELNQIKKARTTIQKSVMANAKEAVIIDILGLYSNLRLPFPLKLNNDLQSDQWKVTAFGFLSGLTKF